MFGAKTTARQRVASKEREDDMPSRNQRWDRIAAVGRLVENARGGQFGRTALMKCLYFLKELRDVPIDYSFKLYTYGPFDSDVLEDLGYATSLDVVKSRAIRHPGGYGYELEPGVGLEYIKEHAKEFLAMHNADIDWVSEKFGNRSASELELISTIIYVDRTLAKKRPVQEEAVTDTVHGVKPHFNKDYILQQVRHLEAEGALQSLA